MVHEVNQSRHWLGPRRGRLRGCARSPRRGTLDPEGRRVMGFAPLTRGRAPEKREAPTEVDAYAQREFGEPNARWLLAWTPSSIEESETRDTPEEGVGLLRRLTRAIASFL